MSPDEGEEAMFTFDPKTGKLVTAAAAPKSKEPAEAATVDKPVELPKPHEVPVPGDEEEEEEDESEDELDAISMEQ